MSNHLTKADSDDRAMVAVYVANMSADLANMARLTGFDTLGFLLEMARHEAEDAVRNSTPGQAV